MTRSPRNGIVVRGTAWSVLSLGKGRFVSRNVSRERWGHKPTRRSRGLGSKVGRPTWTKYLRRWSESSGGLARLGVNPQELGRGMGLSSTKGSRGRGRG